MRIEPIDAARELSPLIGRLRDETEERRCIAEPIVERLRENGMFRMSLPEELGGLELPLTDILEVYETLATAEASVAWVVWNNALPCLLARFLQPPARREIFEDRSSIYAVSTRPTGRASIDGDGYRIEGRWSLVSGCELAAWLMLFCVVEENGAPRMTETGAPEMRFAFVPRDDCEVLDTWYAGGLRGTGSHDVVVRGAHLRREHTLAPSDGCTLDPPLGRVPVISTMAMGYASLALGLARCAVDTLVDLTKTKVTVDPGRPGLSERSTLLSALGRESAALEATRHHVRACADEAWRRAKTGDDPTSESITAAWTSALNAARVAGHTVDLMYAAGGTSSLYTGCPLERAHRDFHALARHLVGQDSWLEDAGRVKLGLQPVNPLYLV